MIAVIIPAHNEAALIGATLAAVKTAATAPQLHGEAVLILVVLDSCDDDTATIAARAGVRTLSVEARNVGVARAAGADYALSMGARWLSFTDADTLVSPRWLQEQLQQQADAVCGTVAVDDWREYGHQATGMRRHFQNTYTDADNHRHIHGANLGVSAAAYRRAGGFGALASGEDVALVRALQASGARIAWSARPRVSTHARKHFRAPCGFGATLLRVAATLAESAPSDLAIEPG